MTTYVAAGPLVNYFFYNAPTIQGGPNVPLEEGKIYFYADEDHSVELNSFSDVFDPNNPTVNPYPLRLGAAGECGIIYLEDRLYYIEIYDKSDVFIRSISHYSPGGSTGGGANDALNYIQNGQFLLHNDLPLTDEFQAGEVRQAVTEIAPGGWTFERPDGSTSTDFVTFEQYDQYTSNPTGNPRFNCRIKCTNPDSGDAYKKLCKRFDNVNRFASSVQQYTVSFSGVDNTDTSIVVDLYLLKNYGTGGSPTTEELIETFSINTSVASYYKSFSFGTNAGKTITEDLDDFIKLEWRFRTNEEFDISITDILQVSGNIVQPVYPETTNAQAISATLGGGYPIYYDGMEIGLYPVRTKEGWRYDDSVVGSVLWTLASDTPEGYVPFDGEESYPYSGISPEGIPYRRIADKLWITASNIYVGGTGNKFVTMQEISGAPENLTLAVNSPGAFTAANNGTLSPGFTFTTVHAGNDYGMTSYYSPDWVIVRMNSRGTFSSPTAGTSGFSVVDFRNFSIVNGISLIGSVSAPSGLAGKYLTVNNPSTSYYPWFQVNGSGSDPAPGGTGILINLQSTYSATETAQHIAASISGQQLTNILFVAASAIPPGAFWDFSCTLGDFYVFYIKDGAGSDPAFSGKKGIKVEISSAFTAAQVANNTLIAVNKAYIGMPDGKGKFPRIWDNGAGWDNPTSFRFNSFGLLPGDSIGSYEIDTIIKHSHLYTLPVQVSGTNIPTTGGAEEIQNQIFPTSITGDEETRPVNINLNAFIKI